MTATCVHEDLELYFENWIREQGFILHKYILSLVRNKELSEDIYQEVLISAYLKLHSLEKTSSLKSWMYKIAINKCRDYWRKEKTQQKFWEERVYSYIEGEQPLPHPEETALRKCEQEEMLQSIHELPEMYSEPILLFYYHNRTLVEISNTKKVPLSTVKTRMRRAKYQLMKRVEQSAGYYDARVSS